MCPIVSGPLACVTWGRPCPGRTVCHRPGAQGAVSRACLSPAQESTTLSSLVRRHPPCLGGDSHLLRVGVGACLSSQLLELNWPAFPRDPGKDKCPGNPGNLMERHRGCEGTPWSVLPSPTISWVRPGLFSGTSSQPKITKLRP